MQKHTLAVGAPSGRRWRHTASRLGHFTSDSATRWSACSTGILLDTSNSSWGKPLYKYHYIEESGGTFYVRKPGLSKEARIGRPDMGWIDGSMATALALVENDAGEKAKSVPLRAHADGAAGCSR